MSNNRDKMAAFLDGVAVIKERMAVILADPGTHFASTSGPRRHLTVILSSMRNRAAGAGVLCMVSLAGCTQAPSMGAAPSFGMQEAISGVLGPSVGKRVVTAIGLPVSPNHNTFQGAATTPGQARLLHALANVNVGTPVIYRDPNDHSLFETYTVLRQGKDAQGRECREFQGERDGRIMAGIVCRNSRGELTLASVEAVHGNSMIVDASPEVPPARRMG